jgi:ubiquinol-cytochrome c reductase cytochrome c subunit
MDQTTRRAPRGLVSWIVLIAGIIVVGVWWNANGAAAQEAQPAGDVDLGGQLYAQFCAQCHASDGTGAEVPGTGRKAPALAGRPDVTAAYVDLVMRTGRMPPPGDPFDNQPREVVFDDRQREAVVAYTMQQFSLEEDRVQVPEGDGSRGQQVYAENCAACHGSTGQGGVAGAGAWTPNVNQYDAVTLAEAIRVGPFEMPAFGPEQITDQEIGDIAAFLEEVRNEEGTPLRLVELNPVFASGFVALMALVLILSLFWISSKPTWFPDPDAGTEASKQRDLRTEDANGVSVSDPKEAP